MPVFGPFSRRQFLRASGGAAVGSLLAVHTVDLEAQEIAPASSDQIKFGIIGVGTEGSALLRSAVTLPNVKCVAASDLYDGRHTLAKEIAGQDVRTTRRYHEVLDDSSIQCVIVATPDFWHKQVVVDALAAGKDVYCEKPMSHSIQEGDEMVEAVRRSGGKFVQVGSQRVSSAVFGKAHELVSSGAIGELMQIELQLGRNSPDGAWEYPPPADLSPENLDWETWQKDVPKKPFDPYTFARWRCWREYGTGMAGDLMVHLLSGMQFVSGINAIPDQATTVAGIYRWKDGRNMPDVQSTVLQYRTIPVSVRLTLATETPEITRVMGTKGVVEVSNNSVTYIPQLGINTGPSYYSQSFPSALRAEYDRKWYAENGPILAEHPLGEVTVYRGSSWDDLRPHLANFFNAVRTRKPVVEDVVFGHHAAAACHMANASYFEGKTIRS
jgi:predicted dehydrogenase